MKGPTRFDRWLDAVLLHAAKKATTMDLVRALRPEDLQ